MSFFDVLSRCFESWPFWSEIWADRSEKEAAFRQAFNDAVDARLRDRGLLK